MNEGRIEQVGTPEQIYGEPANRWVAGFLGEVNVLKGQARDGRASTLLGEVEAPAGLSGPVDVMIRPESLAVVDGGQGLEALVVQRSYYGHDQLLVLELDGGLRLSCRNLGHPTWYPGDTVRVALDGPVTVRPSV